MVVVKPFRWTLSRREQLGSLADAPGALRPEFVSELRDVAARVLAFSDGADLAFIGRTPESFFDYLSGAFEGVGGAPALHLVQFSLRWPGPQDEAADPENLDALGAYFAAEGVDPASIAEGPRPVALVDLVDRGGTLHSVVRVLRGVAARQGVDWAAVQRRLRIVGLVSRTETSPKTWRWQQHQSWLELIPDATIKNVSADPGFITWICAWQPKLTAPFGPARWRAADGVGARDSTPEQRAAVASALRLYDLGRTREEREALAARIAETREMRQANTRALVLALRR